MPQQCFIWAFLCECTVKAENGQNPCQQVKHLHDLGIPLWPPSSDNHWCNWLHQESLKTAICPLFLGARLAASGYRTLHTISRVSVTATNSTYTCTNKPKIFQIETKLFLLPTTDVPNVCMHTLMLCWFQSRYLNLSQTSMEGADNMGLEGRFW